MSCSSTQVPENIWTAYPRPLYGLLGYPVATSSSACSSSSCNSCPSANSNACSSSSSCNNNSNSGCGESVTYGDVMDFNNKNMKTYVVTSSCGSVQEIGVSFNKAALDNLPVADSCMSNVPIVLSLPKCARELGFDHMVFSWNPNDNFNISPDANATTNFSVSLFMASQLEKAQIAMNNICPDIANDPCPSAQANDADFQVTNNNVPANNSTTGVIIPSYGVIYSDPSYYSNQSTYTHALTFGFYQDAMINFNLVFTDTFIQNMTQQSQNGLLTDAVPIPPTLPSGISKYPTAYKIVYQACNGVVRVAMTF